MINPSQSKHHAGQRKVQRDITVQEKLKASSKGFAVTQILYARLSPRLNNRRHQVGCGTDTSGVRLINSARVARTVVASAAGKRIAMRILCPPFPSNLPQHFDLSLS